MVNFGPFAAEIVSLVWGTAANFNGFRVLAALLHGTLVVGVSQTAALNRGHHLYSAGRPSRWALAHISSFDLLLSTSTSESFTALHKCLLSVYMNIDPNNKLQMVLGRGNSILVSNRYQLPVTSARQPSIKFNYPTIA